MRLGVEAALVGGELVPGDVEVVDGDDRAATGSRGRTVAGSPRPGSSTCRSTASRGVDFLGADARRLRPGRRGAARDRRDGVPADVHHRAGGRPARRAAEVRATTRATGRASSASISKGRSSRRRGSAPTRRRRGATPIAALLERLLAAGPVRHDDARARASRRARADRPPRSRAASSSRAGTATRRPTRRTRAFDRGARTVTHLFNAMRPLSHRDPGIVGAALARPDVVVQIIVDGVHLAPEAVQLVWRAAAGRVALVTDAIAAAGVGDGDSRLGDVEVDVRDGVARRRRRRAGRQRR